MSNSYFFDRTPENSSSKANKKLNFPNLIEQQLAMNQKLDKVEVFEANGMKHTVKFYGIVQRPLFRASDIEKIVDVSDDIIGLVYLYLAEQKLHIITFPDDPDTKYITEEGLHEVLAIIQTDITKRLRDWIIATLRELRITGLKVSDMRITDLERTNKELMQLISKMLPFVVIAVADKTPQI